MRQNILLLACLLTYNFCISQTANDDRVLLQGFYWEASHDYSEDWYQHVESKASDMKNAGINMIWLPPPSDAGSLEGYLPRELNNFANNYGTLPEHQSLLSTLDALGIEAIADIVVNHRVGSTNWVDFSNPSWGTNAITADDEVWSNADYSSIGLRGSNDTGTPYSAARDIDHTQTFVQNDIIAFLNNLKAMGYDGWRYDFVHGFDTYYIAHYNNQTNPAFSVGEYWNSDKQVIQNWIDATGSTAFDFPTYYALKGAIRDNNYAYLSYEGAPAGGIGWDPQHNTTFIENHDTPDYDPNNNVLNSSNVGQAYAYLLTHPGVPCIYWSHMYEWGSTVTNEIKGLVGVRKAAGIHSQSPVTIHESTSALYVASVQGANHNVFIKMGYGNWGDPAAEGHGGSWTLAASGTNYAIWAESGSGGGTESMTVYAQGYTHVYAWDANQNALVGNWPGMLLSGASNGWSQGDIPSECANLIFSNNGSGQTADLYTCASEPYYANGDWYASDPGGSGGGGGNAMEVYVQGYTHVYAWDSNQNPLMGTWPGTSLSAGANGWSTADIPAECTNLIFSNNGTGQTADLYTCYSQPYYYDGTWHAADPIGSGSETLTVYVQGYSHYYAWADGGSTVYTGGWPGDLLTDNGDGWYSGSVPAACSNVIFNNAGSGQTADLYTCGPEAYYANGSWSSSAGRIAADENLKVYPNPLLGDGTVSFSLNEAANVKLLVYSTTGQTISILDSSLNKGQYKIDLRAKDLPPTEGIYIIKLLVADEEFTRKVFLR